MKLKTEQKRHGMTLLCLKNDMNGIKFKDKIKGSNCSIVSLKSAGEKAVDVFKSLFNETEIADFLNSEYLKNRTKPKIKNWIKKKINNPVEVWYMIKWKNHYIGYICFKWREHYDEACEISTAIVKEYRGLKLGFESSGILVDYVLSLNKFRYVAAYVFLTNHKAGKNLNKLGFKKANRLHKVITKEFYWDGKTKDEGERRYDLFVIYSGNKTYK